MNYGDTMITMIQDMLTANPGEPVLPQALVEKLLETRGRESRQSGQREEREEFVCRLLASGMPVDEVSLILKIRKEEIGEIERNNVQDKIPDYAKKLQARRKSREREAERRRELDAAVTKK